MGKKEELTEEELENLKHANRMKELEFMRNTEIYLMERRWELETNMRLPVQQPQWQPPQQPMPEPPTPSNASRQKYGGGPNVQ